jgi:tRNA pseudouridine55 synthase
VNGLLLIDKPVRHTSHDVVARVRRAIGIRAIGHAGTLDPFATGLLILCIGHATRLSEYLIGETKAYIGRMKLGERTNTDDLDGEVIERRLVNVTLADLQSAAGRFVGEITQMPPQYSAIQVSGKRAYKLARRGEAVDLPTRAVRIDELVLTPAGDEGPRAKDQGQLEEDKNLQSPISNLQSHFVDLRVTCSAGTYIRALARDLGEVLGCGAHLTSLRRVRSGDFSLDEAVPLETFLQAATEGHWQPYLQPMDRAVRYLPAVHLDEQGAQRFLMGQAVQAGLGHSEDREILCRVYDAGGCFVAIGQADPERRVVKPYKVFHARE